MMELWNCLASLLHPIQDCRVQARQYGVYDGREVRGGDVDGEETMLGKISQAELRQRLTDHQTNGTTNF